MKKVIITDLLILAVFGSTCFWSVKKDRLTALVDKILTEQTSEDEEILVLTSSNLAKKNGRIGETQMSEMQTKQVKRIQQKTISSGWILRSPSLL